MEDPPDTSWLEMEEISDGGVALAWAAFLLTLILGAASIALLLS